MEFKTAEIQTVRENAVELFGSRWALLTAGTREHFNPMTVSWGTLGELWSRPVVTVYVRPSRHTYGFMEEQDFFTLSFFGPEYRAALNLCGSKSGRDMDKAAAAGLTPLSTECGAVAFQEAEMIFVCRKLYRNDIAPEDFTDGSVADSYGGKDFHRQYIAEVVQVLRRD